MTMTEAELIEAIIAKRNELEENRAANVSSSLIRLQEEEIKELEYIYATGDTKRLELRLYLDQCGDEEEKAKYF
jgi:hypothetical protein